MPEPVESLAFKFPLALLEAVFSQDDWRGVNNQNTGITVNDDPVVLFDELACTARPDDRRNIHAARNNGGMRSFAAHISCKACKQALLELKHVGG